MYILLLILLCLYLYWRVRSIIAMLEAQRDDERYGHR